jgi:hypothetical protein
MTFATLSNGMEVLFSHPRASSPTSLAGQICQSLLMTKEQDHLSIRLKYISIQMVGTTLAAHMLSGNFATNRVTTLNNEANSINPLTFLPQRNVCMVEQMCVHDMIASNLGRLYAKRKICHQQSHYSQQQSKLHQPTGLSSPEKHMHGQENACA